MIQKIIKSVDIKWIIMSIITILIPLATFYIYYEIPGYVPVTMRQGEFKIDIYMRIKSYILNFSGFLIVGYSLISFKNKSRENLKKSSYEYKVLFLMSLLILMSTLFSEYRLVSLFGFPERFEGMFIWFIYLMIPFFIKIVMSENDDYYKSNKLLKYSFASVGVIGLTEYFGYYLILQKWFVKIFSTSVIRNQNLEFGYVYSKVVTSTLYNSNFAGSFFALASIFMIIKLLIKGEKKRLNFAIFLVSYFNLIASNSSAGLVAFLLALAISIIFLFNTFIVNKRTAIIIISSMLVLTVFIWNDSGRGNLITSEIENVVESNEVNTTMSKFDDLELVENSIKISFQGNVFEIELTGNSINFYDTDKNPLEYTLYTEGNYFEFADQRYSNIRIEILEGGGAFKYIQGNLTYYIGSEDGKLMIADEIGNYYREYEKPRTFGFEGMESIGSSRGYIWSRSLPIMFDCKFIGKGADTFPYYFPQNDIIGKENFLGGSDSFVDKPHNMFIQIGINFGMPFLLIYLLFVIKYSYDSLKLYFNKRNMIDFEMFGVAYFVSVISYNAVGLFNDSNVATSPTYWIIFGLGLAINSKLKYDKKSIQ